VANRVSIQVGRLFPGGKPKGVKVNQVSISPGTMSKLLTSRYM
jgi:hypothetical protein